MVEKEKVAHDLAVGYAVGFVLAHPEELPNITQLYQGTFKQILDQLHPKPVEVTIPEMPLRKPTFRI